MNQGLSERLRKISERLKKEYYAERVILFGSHAKGKATEDSNVDLLIVAPTKEDFFERIATAKTIVHDLRFGLPFFPIFLTQQDLKERLRIEEQFIEDILKTGEEL